MRGLSPNLLRASIGFIAMAFAADAATSAPGAIPDLSGQWGRDMLFFEPPAAAPGRFINAIRSQDGSRHLQAPCCAIVVEGGWVGDDTNPILKPAAKDAVRKYRDLADSGTVVPDLHNTCLPEPPPFAMAIQFGVNIVQYKDEV